MEWVGLLRSCAAFEAYSRCYTADIRPARVAEFLLLNAESPRSVRFVIDRVEVSLRAIARHAGRTKVGRVDRLAGRLQAALDFSQPLGQDEPVAMATWRSPDPPELSDDERAQQQ